MQVLEQAEPRAGVGGDVDDPNVLAGGEPLLPVLHDLVGETDLAGGEEEHAPAGRPPCRAVAGAARLPRAIREEVGDLPGLSRRDLRQLVEAEERVAMGDRYALQAVGGRAPGPDIAAGLPAAPDRARDGERGALAGRGGAAQVDATALGVAGLPAWPRRRRRSTTRACCCRVRSARPPPSTRPGSPCAGRHVRRRRSPAA